MTSASGSKTSSCAIVMTMYLLQLLSAITIIVAAAPEVRANDAVVSTSNSNKPSTAISSSATDHHLSDTGNHLMAADHSTNDVTDKNEATANVDDKRAMSALRLGRRAMSALRLGRRGDDGVDDSAVEEGELEKRKSMSMLRLGRARNEELELDDDMQDEDPKRAMSALRLGKKSSDAAESLETDVGDEEKRAMSMLRLGRSGAARYHEEDMANDDDIISDDLDKRAMGMLRLGRDGRSRVERRKSMSMLRLG